MFSTIEYTLTVSTLKYTCILCGLLSFTLTRKVYMHSDCVEHIAKIMCSMVN